MATKKIWIHVTLQFLLSLSFIFFFCTLLFGTVWGTIAPKMNVFFRLVTIAVAGNTGLILAGMVGGKLFRVRCQKPDCAGICNRTSVIPIIFNCPTCGSEFKTSVFLGGRR